MPFGAAWYAFAFVSLHLIGCADAEQQKPSSFLSNYDSYKSICHKIGWEPKCRTKPVTGCQGNIIAFQAFLPKSIDNVPGNTIIKFGRVQLNEGNGYDPKSGKFTAPVDGIYSFYWTYCTNKGSNAYLSGYVDGKLTAPISNYGQTSTWQNTSGHLVVKLKMGSQFWIQTFRYTAQHIYNWYTFLSGYKLSAW